MVYTFYNILAFLLLVDMRGYKKFCPHLITFFLVDEGIEDPNLTKMGHHGPASETPLKLWADDGSTLNDSFVIFQGIRTSIAKKPYIL